MTNNDSEYIYEHYTQPNGEQGIYEKYPVVSLPISRPIYELLEEALNSGKDWTNGIRNHNITTWEYHRDGWRLDFSGGWHRLDFGGGWTDYALNFWGDKAKDIDAASDLMGDKELLVSLLTWIYEGGECPLLNCWHCEAWDAGDCLCECWCIDSGRG